MRSPLIAKATNISMIKPELKSLSLRDPIHFLALGFGSGLAPKAPGTFGTIAAIPVVYFCHMLPLVIYGALTLVACIIGIKICAYTADALKTHDHPAIVWDEVAGLMVSCLFIVPTWQNLLLAFVIFRFFDIVKPWPIKWADQKVSGGLGIMLDDVIAGAMTAVSLYLIATFI